jgi:hypothetical protein
MFFKLIDYDTRETNYTKEIWLNPDNVISVTFYQGHSEYCQVKTVDGLTYNISMLNDSKGYDEDLVIALLEFESKTEQKQ